jgi:protein gp37
VSSSTSIEWTEATWWNPVTGCDRVSPGCAHCYALDLAARLKGMGQPKYQRDGDPRTSGPGFGVTLHEAELDTPLRWRRPRLVFVNSMSDLFHEEIPDEFIARVFAVMSLAREHTFQVLTKRPERMAKLLAHPEFENVFRRATGELGHELPLPNVWLGVSIENRRFVDRADLLRETPAAVRFVSAEPLLGPAVEWMVCATCSMEGPDPRCDECEGAESWPLEGGLDLTDIDWLIVGGESGPDHRRMKPQWARDLRDLAELYETAFFFKQWGGRTPKAGGRELDGRTWDEMPAVARA